MSLPPALRLLTALCAVAAISCTPRAERRAPWLVFGIDGADWAVIEAMWADGELPRLRQVAQRGVRAPLKTAYAKSPIIWTSIATGVNADRHGIVDFVIPTDDGDVPLSSKQRKVPAIWNVMTWLERPTAVFGWWATWPAEAIDGVMVSDRFGRDLDDDVYPPDATFDTDSDVLLDDWWRQMGDGRFLDRPVVASESKKVLEAKYLHDATLVTLTRQAVASGDYDLVLGYVRTVDVTSHQHYGCWDQPTPETSFCHPEMVRGAYAAVDRALASVLDASPVPINVLVLSDHGFRKLEPEYRVSMDFDRLLERLGYLKRTADGSIDSNASLFAGFGNPGHTRFKNVRRLSRATDEDVERLREQLLSLRYESGGPVFVPTPQRGPTEDTVMVVRVMRDQPSYEVSGDGIEKFRLVHGIFPLTGSHGRANDGILIAAGPDVASGRLERAHIFDIAPTLAYGLGLPVAEDADGQVRESLFTERFRQRHPLETVSSWGRRDGTEAQTGSSADEEILEELRALGYLD